MLEFHVWGPACGLPSIDAESLALITYASFVLPPTAFTLVTTSPSAVPSHVLPSLYDRATGSWVSGYRPIVSHLASTSTSSSSRLDHDPDARLTPAQRADADALAAFLASRAAPLVALSLYASHTNWSEVVRPAYSRILPFPLTWVEPPLVRDAMLQRAEGLGLGDLDPDAEVPPDGAETSGRPRPPPPSLKTIADYINQGRLGAADRTSEETRAVNKLRSTARTSCLDPLAQALRRAAPDDALSFVAAAAGGDGRAPTSVDCLAYAYLSLMLVPDLPRRWLRDLLASEPSLAALTAFTSALRAAIPPAAPLTLTGPSTTASSSSLAARFLRGALRSAPHVGDALHARDLRLRAATSDDIARRQQRRRDLLHAFCAAVLGSALVAGVLAWRRVPAFGEAVYRWSRPARGFGAAGALLGLYGSSSSSSAGVSFGGGRDGAGGGFRAPQGYAGGGASGVGSGLGGEYEEVPIEMSGRPEVVEVDVEVGSGSS
ncbi:uncharacterized protein E0L32_012181 [Thyridium curvatum]|uniref:Mitochondrial outer membrane transport complex Sam37/metaxin N-terminal domain-containing protein n=1 Tax=Thyridium curvatum TaxID=1093900 RepID=A0A507B509_9PEZI|nr:uncharacterized protein E0L32_012181 [Thyridium curvatum]TPX17352.1 hypothetical protein E0L32_012181 [Thyridium curvatum]